MGRITCPRCNGSGNPAVSGVEDGSAQGCTRCGGTGWIEDDPNINYSNGDNECFTGETKVKIPGGWKEIKDLNVNDFVVSIDKEGQLINRRILRKKQHENCKIQEIFTSEHVINVTPVHSIQLSNGIWKKVSELKNGDSIRYLDSNGILNDQLIIKKKKKNSETVYNLIVEENFTFIVEGCIAHSFTYLRVIRGFLYTLANKLKIVKLAITPIVSLRYS